MSTIEQIQKILKSDFENQLFEACLKNLEDLENKLRYHNFCYSIRELSRHFLYSLSPESSIIKCEWFKVETENGSPTRAQRIKYAIQGGLTDENLKKLGFDLNKLNSSIREIKNIIDSLSKYTHINHENFHLTNDEIETKKDEVLKTFENFAETINNYRHILNSFLDGKIEDDMIEKIILNSYENIDCLAPHYSLEDGEVQKYHIEEITAEEIIVNVEGSVYVTLEYGSRKERADNDGLDVELSFPFKTQIRYEISNEFPSNDYDVDDFDVDTSSWYDNGDEFNEDF
ncbi:hypothetical protein NU08_0957 [Flavobacterium anhuiense]|uniref:Uncharacterized protein n=1 Tax=Flavobacterium anhuiense TaxID=459526 RepID=A0A444W2T0_9FLAO|nr:hypothetical protein [Flavobacterium anhuiense]RYJ40201.1 hypothetical protein NU08_0957 [Flavobacterium anhuiense]